MHVVALNVFPIKGCRGTSLTEVEVDRIGLVGDRRLMLVDSRGRFVSQRENPRLATLEPWRAGTTLEVRAESGDVLKLELDPAGPMRSVSVWGRHGIEANDQGDTAAAWFSEILLDSYRLVYFGPGARNPVDPEFSPRADAETAFTDGYPIMAALQESLDDLNTRLDEAVPMERFRPSVVVGGAPAWSEDAWSVIDLGGVRCDAVKPCARCVVTTTDQWSGARHPHQEPLRTLASFRTRPGFGAVFGQNLVPQCTGRIRVGDPVALA